MMQDVPNPIVLLLTLMMLGLAPFMAVMVTSFAKIVIVLSLVRNALGIQQVPPNLILNGLALVLTMFIMAPVGNEIGRIAEAAMAEQEDFQPAQFFEIAGEAREPLREFLSAHAQPAQQEFFMRSAHALWPAEQAEELRHDDLMVLVPAFTVSELIAAFKIGILLYLAFVVIDLLVANVLIAMGMMMFAPVVVSVPLKLLLFVMVDGWGQLIHGLVLTYQ